MTNEIRLVCNSGFWLSASIPRRDTSFVSFKKPRSVNWGLLIHIFQKIFILELFPIRIKQLEIEYVKFSESEIQTYNLFN